MMFPFLYQGNTRQRSEAVVDTSPETGIHTPQKGRILSCSTCFINTTSLQNRYVIRQNELPSTKRIGKMFTDLVSCGWDPPRGVIILSATTLSLCLPLQISVTPEGFRRWGMSPSFSTPSSLYDVGTVLCLPHNFRSSMILFPLDLGFP